MVSEHIICGGILSSKEESFYSIESPLPKRQPLDITEAFRTYYRIDELQKNYFVINQLSDLQQIVNLDLISLLERSRALGMKPTSYSPKEEAAC